MDNPCFVNQLAVISIGRDCLPDFDYRVWVWVQASGLDVQPTESTHQLITRLDDGRLVGLSNQISTQLQGGANNAKDD